MKALLVMGYTVGCIGIPWFFGWLTMGRGSFPEPIAVQWAFGLIIAIGAALVIGLFIAGLQAIIKI